MGDTIIEREKERDKEIEGERVKERVKEIEGEREGERWMGEKRFYTRRTSGRIRISRLAKISFFYCDWL